MRSVENKECGKSGVWKTRSVENAECGKGGENFIFHFNFHSHAEKQCGRTTGMLTNFYKKSMLYTNVPAYHTPIHVRVVSPTCDS